MNIKTLLAAMLIPIIGFSQQDFATTVKTDSLKKSKVFQLGEVLVTTEKDGAVQNRISSATMESLNKTDVAQALNMLGGISTTVSGARNESMVSVRGFDLRQVPVFMDGIPVYVPYDGYVDLARFTTFDLAAIDVAKGFSSVLYGANSLGGAINLISRKPVDKFEIDGSLGMININGYRGALNAGSNFGKFFIQGGYSYLHRDSYIMSSNFVPTARENGKTRDNSYRTDQKVNVKIGYTPNQNHEYVIGYINQMGKKGVPVYCGTDSLNSLLAKPRYWQWPAWNKETVYFLSRTNFGDGKHAIKTKFYYDAFKNRLNSFDDSTYTTQSKPYAFSSFYNDYTLGGNIEYGTTILPKNELKIAVNYKQDIHRENNLNEKVRHYSDGTFIVGIEDIYHPIKQLAIMPGFSFSMRKNMKAENYNSSEDSVYNFQTAAVSYAYNGQLGIFYSPKDNHKLGLTYAHKTRFATIKDRYSYRMGTALPNPTLKPESSENVELSYTGRFFNKVTFQPAFFFSYLTDVMINVSNVQPGKAQMQNAGKAYFTGVEAQLNYDVYKKILQIGANYTYLYRHNISNPKLYFTDIPAHKVFAFIQYEPVEQVKIITSVEYNSARYSTSYGTQSRGFALVNLAVSSKIWKYIGLDAGVNNMLDKNYSLTEGYPEEGRNFYVTLRVFAHK
ncbi:MAG: TonB-dependent receptor [Bacteroidetes bacterium]|nr:TonB-dependent receptor [Bacteroidota bacterium]